MIDPRFAAIFDAFVADGNTVTGPRPTTITDSFDIVWRGGGSVIEFGENVTLTSVKMAFPGGGGTIRLGRNVTVKGRLEVSGSGMIAIDEDTFLNRQCDIRGGEGAQVMIGKRCLFSNVKVMTSDMHSIIDQATGKRTNPAASIVIEDDVWLAEDVKVAKGVRIGAGSVIASGSLVTRPVGPFCLAAGRPARVLRSGVGWKRDLKKMAPLPPPKFKPEDIPFEKEALRLLVARKQYRLVEAVISAAMGAGDVAGLPLFARWYLVLSRHKLGMANPAALETLDQIIAERPDHEAARNLRASLASGAP